VNSATIFADASYDDRNKAAGWAAWIKADGRASAMASGAFKALPSTSSDAELLALANAVYSANRLGMIDDGAEILLQSDCLHALSIVLWAIPGAIERRHQNSAPIARYKQPRLKDDARKAVEVIRAIVAARGLKIACRHVRGHTEGAGRQYVNRAVDAAARKAMEVQRSGITASRGS
jgi:ribonuclease HI